MRTFEQYLVELNGQPPTVFSNPQIIDEIMQILQTKAKLDKWHLDAARGLITDFLEDATGYSDNGHPGQMGRKEFVADMNPDDFQNNAG